MNININVESIIQKVTEVIKTETVIGDPITIGQITMIPIINVSFGFGGGGGDGKSSSNEQGNGAGGGGGARMTVSGMMVVKGDEVTFIPTGKGAGKTGSIDKLLDTIPELIEKVSGKKSKGNDIPDIDPANN